MADVRMALNDGSLADLLDRLVATGAVVDGNVIITLAGVDLIRLDLHAMLAATETLRPYAEQLPADTADRPAVDRRAPPPTPAAPPRAVPAGTTGEPPADPRDAVTRPEPPPRRGGERGGHRDTRDSQPALAGLVVAVVDIVRQLLERQALRRMAAGSLTDDEVEHLGRALMALERQVAELTEVLGLRHQPAAASGRADRSPQVEGLQ